MNTFLAAALSLNTLLFPLADAHNFCESTEISNELFGASLYARENEENERHYEVSSFHAFLQRLCYQFDLDPTPFIQDTLQQTNVAYDSSDELIPGDFLFFGSSENENQQIGLYLGQDQFLHFSSPENLSGYYISRLTDREWQASPFLAYRIASRLDQHNLNLTELQVQPIEKEEDQQISPIVVLAIEAPSFLTDQFHCYYVNEQRMPLVISPKDQNVSLLSFQAWAQSHQEEFRSFLAAHGSLLLRDFPVEKAEDFASIVKSVLGRDLLDYRGGEGSRKKVADGVYTSTEAPPQFKIPLHNELSCTNRPAAYICFYCDIAPQPGT